MPKKKKMSPALAPDRLFKLHLIGGVTAAGCRCPNSIKRTHHHKTLPRLPFDQKKHFVHQFGTNSPTRHQASPRRSLHALFQKHRKHPVHPIRPIHPTHPAHPTPSPRKRPDDPFATRRETRRPSLPQFSGRMVNPHGNTMSPGCLSLTKLSEISSSSASSTTRMSLDALRP